MTIAIVLPKQAAEEILVAPIPQAFTLNVADATIADLHSRLSRTRLPDQAPDPAWAFGSDVGYLRGLLAYWQNGFDWRAQEAALNAFAQFHALPPASQHVDSRSGRASRSPPHAARRAFGRMNVNGQLRRRHRQVNRGNSECVGHSIGETDRRAHAIAFADALGAKRRER